MTELEEDKNYLQTERDNLLVELESNAQSSDKNTQKFQEARLHKLKSLKVQIAALNNKQEAWSQYLRQQQCSDGDGKRKSKETHEENEPQELQMWSITTGLKGFFQEFMPRNLLYRQL